MHRAFVLALVATVGCGRVGFEATGGDAGGPDSGSAGDARTDDALQGACVAGDGECRVSCLGTDDDCTTTCGDGVCVGNAGELCPSCPADCNSTAVDVCGNGRCDPPEDSDLCYADCGPTPWMWTAEEADLFTRVNALRTGGFACPGGGGATTAPALTRVAGLDLGARGLTWEIAFHGVTTVTSCTGRPITDWGFYGGGQAPFDVWGHYGSATPQDALAFMVMDQVTCDSIMNPAYTSVGVGVTYLTGKPNAYTVIVD